LRDDSGDDKRGPTATGTDGTTTNTNTNTTNDNGNDHGVISNVITQTGQTRQAALLQ
jgi:hypothetical protein